MDNFYALGHSIMSRMSNPVKFTFVTAVFAIPPFMLTFMDLQTAVWQWSFGISIAVMVYIALCFYSQSLKGWEEMMPLLDRLSEGDFTAKYDTDVYYRTGPFVVCKALAGDIDGRFDTIVRRARAGSRQILSASKEITDGNAQLAQHTERQAASLEETASAMEELAATVKHNADSCRTAHALTEKASDVAESGSNAVRDAMEAMGNIERHSKKVAEIVDVVANIAFQTNILALNAAVEAARAGEHGHGFSVVASEVRNLSERSAEAVKEIRALIDASGACVEEGNQLVKGTGALIEDVLKNVREVSQRVAEIAAASNEQSAGVEETNRALTQLDRMTQQNAALAEQTREPVQAFEQEAPELAAAVLRFKIADDTTENDGPTEQTAASPQRTASRPASAA